MSRIPLLLACLMIATPVVLGQPAAAEAQAELPQPKHTIGATADFLEEASGLRFTARIDTGATTCSIHAEEVKVEEADEKMQKNIGKKVSFVLLGPKGERKRVESTIADTVRVKTSDKDRWERRYKVWMTLQHGEVSRRVHVTLNNRKHMAYRLLIGRNYLCGRFVVDVATKHSPLLAAEGDQPAEEGEANATEQSAAKPAPSAEPAAPVAAS